MKLKRPSMMLLGSLTAIFAGQSFASSTKANADTSATDTQQVVNSTQTLKGASTNATPAILTPIKTAPAAVDSIAGSDVVSAVALMSDTDKQGPLQVASANSVATVLEGESNSIVDTSLMIESAKVVQKTDLIQPVASTAKEEPQISVTSVTETVITTPEVTTPATVNISEKIQTNNSIIELDATETKSVALGNNKEAKVALKEPVKSDPKPLSVKIAKKELPSKAEKADLAKTKEKKVSQEVAIASNDINKADKVAVSHVIATGAASWYGRPFHGRKTANGETYNMYGMSAAHKTMRLGTRVKVTNLNNSKSVIVKVNDRGPYVGARILDVSYAAAQALGFVSSGTTRVKIESLR